LHSVFGHVFHSVCSKSFLFFNLSKLRFRLILFR
jgi:hypothetical protein